MADDARLVREFSPIERQALDARRRHAGLHRGSRRSHLNRLQIVVIEFPVGWCKWDVHGSDEHG